MVNVATVTTTGDIDPSNNSDDDVVGVGRSTAAPALLPLTLVSLTAALLGVGVFFPMARRSVISR